jgi:hypothetical protein
MRRGLISADDWDEQQKLEPLTDEPLISPNKNRNGGFWSDG